MSQQKRPSGTRRAWAGLAGLVVVGAALSGCGAAPRSFGGGNLPGPSVPVTTAAPTGTPKPTVPATTTTTTVAPSRSTPTTIAPKLPPGEHSAFGTPQKGQPWKTPGSPEWVAARWVAADHYLSWQAPVVAGTGLGYWAQLIRPYSTPAWWRRIAGTVIAAEDTGTAIPSDRSYWAQVVRTKKTKTVQILEANRVDQAGWTATSEIVQVTWWMYTTTGAGSTPPGTRPGLTVDFCTMSKVGGRWLVSYEINALNQQ
jgi:hypothetical protein